jgi:hypothetical protein
MLESTEGSGSRKQLAFSWQAAALFSRTFAFFFFLSFTTILSVKVRVHHLLMHIN